MGDRPIATAKAGLILVNINPAYRLAELEYALNKAGCVALITATQFKSSDYVGMLSELAPEFASASPGNLRRHGCPSCGWSLPSAPIPATAWCGLRTFAVSPAMPSGIASRHSLKSCNSMTR
jgi:hypothetical protein